VQKPQTGSGGGITGTFTPPSTSDTLTVTFSEKEIENLLPRAADETGNKLNIKLEADGSVTKIIIRMPVSAIQAALEAWVFSTEFDTPLGKIGFENQLAFDNINAESQFVICTVTKDESSVTIDDNPLKAGKTDENSEEKSFLDLDESHWAYEYIMTLVNGGYLNGISETEFCPDENVTREQFAKMLVSVLNIYDSDKTCDFSDLTEEHWAYSYIASAVSAGIISGYDDGTFGISKNITRQEMAVMVSRAKSDLPEKITKTTFADNDEIADWAASAVEKMQKADILSGMPDGTFLPNANATRAQAAKIIYSILLL